MDLERFCSASRVVIVAGKGGVGKTTVTAALATAATRTGMSVLIVEVEGKSGLAACFDRPPLTYEEQELRPGLRARTLTPDEALIEYLEDHGMRRISRRLTATGALDVVATAVPGHEGHPRAGKVKALERAGAADLIVLDAPAAGHAISFLMSAAGCSTRCGSGRSASRRPTSSSCSPTRAVPGGARHRARRRRRSPSWSRPRSRSRTAPVSRWARSS